ncbi:bifunctional glutamate N-acetyltransferase/amino-acid acetyltransferase ArgJ [Alphaproteobacteria bacterium]|nr:bifunctional glutamate N-acetyltransferase/amino-acid acetyltransferase ArgJ [Alphaproteobacteria bacterium]
MANNRSTKDLSLSSNERLYLKDNHSFLFKIKKAKDFKSKYLDFYTFHVGFKKKLDDLLLVVFKELTPLSAVYSKTSTPSAPIIWDKKNNKGFCKLLIINSGNANAHTGKNGVKAIDRYVAVASKYFKCKKSQILVSSTGVIGEKLNVDKIIKIFPKISKSKPKNLFSASKAIMTTDTYPKNIVKKIKINSKVIRIFGIAKGSGMIFPNMGTMLSYIFIEANLSKEILKKMLHTNLDTSFNSISVDSDTSTSDTLMLFSLSGQNQKKIKSLYIVNKILNALKEIMSDLSLQIISDGEGISKLIEVKVSGAKTYKQATAVSFSIANSPLVKTAIAGEDANWGRVIMAIGKADSQIDQNKIKLKFGNYLVANKGHKYEKINLKKLDTYMLNKHIKIIVDLGLGKFQRTVYSSDLTHEYIRINADYRS